MEFFESISGSSMILTSVSLSATYLCALYIYVKSVKAKLSKKSIFMFILFSFIFSITITAAEQNYFSVSRLIFLILTICSFVLADKKYELRVIPMSMIAIGLSHGIKMISAAAVALIDTFVGLRDVSFMDLYVSVAVHFVLTVMFMRIRRFQNGFSFFREKENISIGLIISGIIVILSCFDFKDERYTTIALFIIVFGILISAIGLVIWIRRKITMLYRKRLESRAEVHYQAMLEEKDKYIEQLLKCNEFLSKVVHRDNHLMGALQHTIGQYLNSNDESERERILGEILTMAEERSEIIRKEQISSKVLPSTGVSMIDGTLGELYIKAAAHNIDFDVTVSEQLHYLVNNILSQTDIQTLLCDHIKDAVIAVESAGHISGKILVSFAMPDSIYEIAVKDNGIDFDSDTLQKLGTERVTTHAGSGGSGIGFMTTFETLRKVQASLIITEYKEKQPFSKSVAFRFDGQNQFIIRTYRKNALAASILRHDLIITS